MSHETLPVKGPSEEPASLQIVRYRDADGNPTCAIDFQTGRVCAFYGTQQFGQRETCWFAEKSGRKWDAVQRRNGGLGTLIPIPLCPVWHQLKP